MERRTIGFTGEMTRESVVNLIDKIDDINSSNIRIYFETCGGEIEATNALLDYINSDPEKFEVVFFNSAHSSGFYFLINLQCKKRIIYPVKAQIHLGTIELDVRGLKDGNSWDYYINEVVEIENKMMLETFRKFGITEQEEADILTGKDVYINPERIRDYIENE